MSIKANYWQPIDDQYIQCDLCPRHCRIKDGSRGFCYVRKNEENTLILTTYGKSSGFCIDPIEKKPLNHFYPGSSIFSLGTVGCNLGCKFCQNWDISKSREMERLQQSASPSQIAIAAKQSGCVGVAYTYNDPVIFIEYAIDIAKACKSLGLKSVAVSAGYIETKPRIDFFEVMDAVNIDLKAFTNTFYKKLCMSNLQPVLDTLRYIKHETTTWLEITTLLIPGENDSPQEIESLSTWIAKELGPDVPLHFTAFHPEYKLLQKSKTTPQTLLMAHDIAKKSGLHYVYTGNILHEKTQSTYCPGCNNKLISRNWHEIKSYDIVGSSCGKCGQKIAGEFPRKPGHWGRKRRMIRL